MTNPRGDSDRSTRRDDAFNPFIAFRRFADEQVGNLLHGIFGISPSAAQRYEHDYQTWLKVARDSHDRLNRQREDVERLMDIYTKAHNEGQDPAQEEIEKAIQCDSQAFTYPHRSLNRDSPAQLLTSSGRRYQESPDEEHVDRDSFKPVSSLFAAINAYSNCIRHSTIPKSDQNTSHEQDSFETYEDCINRVFMRRRVSSSESMNDSTDTYGDCVRRMMSSEAYGDCLGRMMGSHPDNRDEDSRSRGTIQASSEDTKGLIHFILHRPPWLFGDRDAELDSPHDKNLSSIWLKRSLPEINVPTDNDDYGRICLAKPGFQRKVDGSVIGEAQPSESDEETTELDFYEKMRSDDLTSALPVTSRTFISNSSDATPYVTDKEKPNILSTLTTTERTTLQDGTVHTKTVLRKRFSDGREETTETIHTQDSLQRVDSAADQENSKCEKVIDGEAKRSKGWFWT